MVMEETKKKRKVKKRRVTKAVKQQPEVSKELNIIEQAFADAKRDLTTARESMLEAAKEADNKAANIEVVETTPQEIKQANIPKVERHYTKRTIMLVASGFGIVIGVGGFLLYIITQSMVLAVPAIIIGLVGIIGFKYSWDMAESLATEYIGEVPKKQVNCMNIYKDCVAFEDFTPEGKQKPDGFLHECLNDHKKYYVNISEFKYSEPEARDNLAPFVLPDQSYCNPRIFGERVLGLPAHRQLFKRREKLGQVIKTALLVVTIVILWVVIMTTTG